MTVQQLIDKLEKVKDKNKQIVAIYDGGECYARINYVKEYKGGVYTAEEHQDFKRAREDQLDAVILREYNPDIDGYGW